MNFFSFFLTAPGFCEHESTVTSAGNYSWPMTAAEVTFSLACVFGAVDDSSTGNATRECGLMGDWMDPDLSQCISGFNEIKTMDVSSYMSLLLEVVGYLAYIHIHTDYSRKL